MTAESTDFLSILGDRGKDLPTDRYAYKLSESDAYGMDFVIASEPEVDEESMSFVLPFGSGEKRDGVGDLLEIGGIDCSRHRKNPISLFDHGKQYQLPIGLFEDPKTKAYTVFLDPIGKIATGRVFMYQGKGIPGVTKDREYDHALFCEQLFDLWAKKYIRAGSIGYQIKAARELSPDYETGVPKGLHLLSTLMLEGSAVVLPANADTVSKALSLPTVCGKPLSPYLVKSLQQYAPPKKVMLGWEERQGKDLTVPIPHGDLTKTDVPPVEWKPGVGADKDLNGDDTADDYPVVRYAVQGKSQPSDDIKPAKARQILKDGEVHGKPLTEKQRGMFGAAANKDLDDEQQNKALVLDDALIIGLIGAGTVGIGYLVNQAMRWLHDVDEEDFHARLRKMEREGKITIHDGQVSVIDPSRHRGMKTLHAKHRKKDLNVGLQEWVTLYDGERGQVVKVDPQYDSVTVKLTDGRQVIVRNWMIDVAAKSLRGQKDLPTDPETRKIIKQLLYGMIDEAEAVQLLQRKVGMNEGEARREIETTTAAMGRMPTTYGSKAVVVDEESDGWYARFRPEYDGAVDYRPDMGPFENEEDAREAVKRKYPHVYIHRKDFPHDTHARKILHSVLMGTMQPRKAVELLMKECGYRRQDAEREVTYTVQAVSSLNQKRLRSKSLQVKFNWADNPNGTAYEHRRIWISQNDGSPRQVTFAELHSMLGEEAARRAIKTSIREGTSRWHEVRGKSFGAFRSKSLSSALASMILAYGIYKTVVWVLNEFSEGSSSSGRGRWSRQEVENTIRDLDRQGQIKVEGGKIVPADEKLKFKRGDKVEVETTDGKISGVFDEYASGNPDHCRITLPDGTAYYTWTRHIRKKFLDYAVTYKVVGDGITLYEGENEQAANRSAQSAKRSGKYQSVILHDSGLGEMRVKRGKSLDLTTTRKKYRTGKGLRRRLRKSIPGTSITYVASKDLDAARDMAEAKGCKFSHEGSRNGFAKVKLIGSDEGMDAVAREYGKRIKSLQGSTMPAKDMRVYTTPRPGSDIPQNARRVLDSAGLLFSYAKPGDTGGWHLVYPRGTDLQRVINTLKRVGINAVEMDNGVYLEGKSLQRRGKSMNEEPIAEEVLGEKDMSDESNWPYGAQVMKRLLDDHKQLLQDYDEMHGPLEHPELKKMIQKKLETIAGELDDWEAAIGKHYPDLSGSIIGEVGHKEMDEEVEETDEFDDLGDEFEEVEEDIELDDKDLDTMDDDGVPADSDPEPEPTAEEALEGMQTKRLRRIPRKVTVRRKSLEEDEEEKSLFRRKDLEEEEFIEEGKRLRSRRKSACPCGKEPCECDEKGLRRRRKDFEEEMIGMDEPINDLLEPKGLDSRELGMVTEAAGHAKNLSGMENLDEEARMKSFHYHKTLEGMAQLDDLAEGKSEFVGDSEFWQEEAAETEHKDLPPGEIAADMPNPGDVPGQPTSKNLHPHRQACKDASVFFGDVARTKDWGETHRQDAQAVAKALEEISASPSSDAPSPPEDEGFEVGEMGEKSFKAGDRVIDLQYEQDTGKERVGVVVSLTRRLGRDVAMVKFDDGLTQGIELEALKPANKALNRRKGMKTHGWHKNADKDEVVDEETKKALKKTLQEQQKQLRELHRISKAMNGIASQR